LSFEAFYEQEITMRYPLVLLSAGFLVVTAAVAPANRAAAKGHELFLPPSSGTCSIKKTEVKSDAFGFDETAQTNFAGIPSLTTSFTQKKSGCVMGTLAADAGAETSGNHLELEILLDGNACSPFDDGSRTYYFANSGDDFTSHSVGYFCGSNVSAGAHTITVFYASANGSKVAMYQRSITVAHN
jgi:hypothetical protein